MSNSSAEPRDVLGVMDRAVVKNILEMYTDSYLLRKSSLFPEDDTVFVVSLTFQNMRSAKDFANLLVKQQYLGGYKYVTELLAPELGEPAWSNKVFPTIPEMIQARFPNVKKAITTDDYKDFLNVKALETDVEMIHAKLNRIARAKRANPALKASRYTAKLAAAEKAAAENAAAKNAARANAARTNTNAAKPNAAKPNAAKPNAPTSKKFMFSENTGVRTYNRNEGLPGYNEKGQRPVGYVNHRKTEITKLKNGGSLRKKHTIKKQKHRSSKSLKRKYR